MFKVNDVVKTTKNLETFKQDDLVILPIGTKGIIVDVICNKKKNTIKYYISFDFYGCLLLSENVLKKYETTA